MMAACSMGLLKAAASLGPLSVHRITASQF